MTGIAEAYASARGPGRARVVGGVVLFLAGVVAVAAAVVLGTVGLGDLSQFAARRAAGTLAGLGVPAALLGVLVVIPASRRVYAAAIVGCAIAVLGVGLFWEVWSSPFWAGRGGRPSYRLHVAAVYATGALTAAASLFAGLASAKERRRPGGTARLAVTEHGRIKLVDATAGIRDQLTETVSDGGSVAEPVVGDLDDAEVLESPERPRGPQSGPTDADDDAAPSVATADRYCGNCRHFDYVRTRDGLQPYCGFHDEEMDDVDPCEEWTINRSEDLVVN